MGLWIPLLVLVVALATAAIIVSEIDANDKKRQEQDAINRCLETAPRPDPCFQRQEDEDVRRCLEKARDRCLR